MNNLIQNPALAALASLPEPAAAHLAGVFPREGCGLFVECDGAVVFVPCRNVAPSADHFTLPAQDWAAAEDRGRVVAVLHSHPDAAPTPSMADRVSCEASGLPWLIVSMYRDEAGNVRAGEQQWLLPEGYRAPLLGRPFVHGVLDCYSLIRDWYRDERAIELPDYPRRDGWWHEGGNLYRDHFAEAGFVALPADAPLRRGDVLLMQVRATVDNHGAVYLGDGQMLHHLYGQLSRRDTYGGYWLKHTTLRVRHVAEAGHA
ncbi:C40 family peptidase [Chitiniphilus shinanonensis]|uniref:C40 family peptidase n=1 Tax=Chitiniphilus shinanonensis TaxID=553088 RepID=UPI00301FA831